MRKKLVLSLILLLAFGFGVLIFIPRIFEGEKPKDTEVSQKAVVWRGIVLGKTTQSEAVGLLGKPVSEEKGILEFRSESETRNNRLYLTNDIIVLVKEIIPFNSPKKASDIKKEFGGEELVLSGPESPNGFNLYAYPTKGTAYIGNPQTGSLLEIWYFIPTQPATFTSDLAKSYSTSPVQSF